MRRRHDCALAQSIPRLTPRGETPFHDQKRVAWILCIAVMLATASVVSGQSITDGRRVEFIPSAEHDAVDPTTGASLVLGYSLQVFTAGGTTPVQTLYLGKPAPETDGLIRLDFAALLPAPLTPGVIYEAVVEASDQAQRRQHSSNTLRSVGPVRQPSRHRPSRSRRLVAQAAARSPLAPVANGRR